MVVLSEYGITPVQRPIHPNRLLRDAGLLTLKTDLGREYLDPTASRAFAVADHQICHVYVRHPSDLPRVREVFAQQPGIEQILDQEGKRAAGLDHPSELKPKHLARRISVAELAHEMCLSPSHFHAQFKDSVGLTPHQYLLKTRLDHAARLLREMNRESSMYTR